MKHLVLAMLICVFCAVLTHDVLWVYLAVGLLVLAGLTRRQPV